MKKKNKLLSKWRQAMLAILLLFVGFSLQAQNVTWQPGGYPKVNPSPVTIYDTSYVEVYFTVDANVTGARVVLTAPTGTSFVAKQPELLAGNTIAQPTSTTTTITLGNLTTSSVVHFRKAIITTTCAIAEGLTVGVQVDKGTGVANILTTVDLPISFQKPGLNILMKTPTILLADNIEIKNDTVKLSASVGVLNNLRMTIIVPKTGGIQNIKLAGTPILTDGAHYAKGVVNSGADTAYTLVFDNAFLATAIGGKLTAAPVDLTMEVLSYTPCGSKTVTVNGWYPSTVAAATNATIPTGACGSTTGTFAIKMTELPGIPNFQPQTARFLAPYSNANLFKYDKTTLMFSEHVFKNVGAVDGYITSQTIEVQQPDGATQGLGTSYMEIDSVFYKIGNTGQEKRIDPATINISWTLANLPRKIDPPYATKPVRVYFAVPDPVPADSIITYRYGRKMGQFYDTTGVSTGLTSYYFEYVRAYAPTSVNACGVAGLIGGIADVGYTAPAMLQSPPALSARANQLVTANIAGLLMGSLMQSNNGMKQSIDLFVKLPSWMNLNSDSLAANTAIKLTNQFNDKDVWPLDGNITSHGNNTYSIHLTSDKNIIVNDTYRYNNGNLSVYCKTGACISDTANVTDTITYWINYNSYGEGNVATAERPTFVRIGQAVQPVTLICKEKGFVLEDFYLRRTNKGYTDLNNDNIPDNNTIASDNDINHYQYIIGDSAYMVWKGHIAGTTDSVYKRLYALLTTESVLTISSNGANNFLVPFTTQASITINGTPQSADSLKYTRLDNNRCYLSFSGEIKGTDIVEIHLPFYFRAGWTNSPPNPKMSAECFVSDSISANPFTNPIHKKGDDKIETPQLILRGLYWYCNSNTQTPIAHNNPHSFPSTLNWDQFVYIGSLPFPNEVRMPRTYDSLTIEMPDGYEFTADSMQVLYRKYKNDNSSTDLIKYFKPCYFSEDKMVFDLKQFFDVNYPNTPLDPNKWMLPVESTRIYIYPMYRSTKGAPPTTNATVTHKYTNLISGEALAYVQTPLLLYTGQSTSLTSSITTINATTSTLNVPVLSVGNPNNIPINNVWLYVEGNVKNISLKDGSNNTTVGKGYQGRWLKVANNIPNNSNALQYSFNATYTGAAGCTDQFRIYTVSSYDTLVWIPDTLNALNKADIGHSGASRRITITIPPATVGGSLSVSNLNPAIPTGTIVYDSIQVLTARLNSYGSSGMVAKGKIILTVPAGQEYKPGTAKIAYPSDGTLNPVASTYDSYLATTINANLSIDRTVEIDFGKALGDTTAMINGTGTLAEQEALFQLQFIPKCATKLTGMRYEGLLSGQSACGVIATNDGKRIFSAGQYPNLQTNYKFVVNNTFVGQSAVGPIDTLLNMTLSVKKQTGPTYTINTTDSLELKMHKSINLASATYVETTRGTLKIGSNTVDGSDVRTIRLSFPAAYYNNPGNSSNLGVDTTTNYTLKLSYKPANYTILDGDQQPLSASMISMQTFSVPAGCPLQYATIGNKDTTMSILMFNPYPNQVCPHDSTVASIPNTTSSTDYTFNWYHDAAKAIAIGTGDAAKFLASSNARDTLYVDVVKTANSKSLGLVRYPYSTYAAVLANFSADSICLGTATTFTDKTKVGVANASAANVSSWAWYLKDSTTAFSTSQNPTYTFTTAGDHSVKLVVYSINGCKDSITHVAYVKPRTTVQFSAAPTNTCAGVDVNFTNTSTLVGGTATYQYKYGDNKSDATGIHAYGNVLSLTTYTVTLVATTNLGCVDSANNVTVTVNPAPVIATTAARVCSGVNVNLSTYVTNPSNYPLSYYTVATGGTALSSSTVNVTKDTLFYVEAKNLLTGCLSIKRDTIKVSVDVLPVVQVKDTSLCSGNSIDASDLVANPSNYSLEYYTSLNGSGTMSSTVNAIGTSTTNLYVAATNPITGCTSSPRKQIKVTSVALPTLSVNQSSQTKNNGESNDMIVFTPSPSGATVSWTNSDATIGIAASGTGTSITPRALTNSTGADISAVITAIATNGNCVSTSVVHTITLKANSPYTISPLSQTLCNGANTQAITFNGSSSIKYHWTADKNIGQTKLADSSLTGLSSFVAMNSTSTAVTATFTVTPKIGAVSVGTPQTFTITVNPSPAVSTKTLATCAGTAIDLTTAITGLQNLNNQTEVWFSTDSLAFDANRIVLTNYTPAATGKIFVRGTNAITTCVGTISSFMLNVNPLPTFTTQDTAVCTGNTVALASRIRNLLNATAANVEFSTGAGSAFDGGLISSTTAAAYPVNNTVTIYARAKNSNNCTSTIGQFSLTANPLPTFTTQGITICAAATTNLQNAVVNLQNATLANLEFSTINTFATTIATPTTYTQAATGTLYVRAKNANNCTSTVGSFTFTVNPVPTVTLQTISTCEGTAINLTTAVTALQHAVITEVEYSTTNGATFDANKIVSYSSYLPSAASTTLYARATNVATQCAGTMNSFTLTRNPLPTITTKPITVCSNDSINLNDAIVSTTNGGTATIQFSTGTGNAFDGGIISNPIAYRTLSSTTIYVRLTNPTTNCVSTIGQFTITANALPSFNTQGLSTCNGSSVNLQNAVINLINGAMTDVVFNTAANFGAGTNIAAPTTYLPSTTTTIYARATNGNNCVSSSNFFTVSVNPVLTITTQDIATCEGVGVNLQTAITNVTNATLNEVLFSSDSLNFDANKIIAYSTYVPTVAGVKLYARATNGATNCAGSIVSFMVTRNPLPTFATSNKTTCSGVAVDLTTAISSLLNAGTGTVEFSTTSGASFDAGIITNATAYSTLNTITIYARVKNPTTTCVSAIHSFTVTTTPLPVFTTQGLTTCSGNSVNLQNAIVNLQNAILTTDMEFSTVANFATTIATQTNYTPAATATIYARAKNSNNCMSDVKVLTVTVNPSPTLTLQGISTCAGSPVSLQTAVSGVTDANLSEVNFSTSNSSFDANKIIDPINYLPSATITLYAQAKNAVTTCSSPIGSFVVSVNALPAFTVANRNVCAGSSLNLNDSVKNIVNGGIGTVEFSTNATAFDANKIQNANNYSVLNNTTVYARLKNPTTACVSTLNTFIVTANPLPTFVAQNISVCQGINADLTTAISGLQNADISEVEFNTSASFASGSKITTPNAYSAASTATIYVRAKNATTSCQSADGSFVLTINALPTVNTIANQTVCNGSITDLYIDGTANSYIATSSNFAAVTPSFQTNDAKHLKLVSTNVTTAPVNATITVTPLANGCQGTDKTFTVTVNPTPTMNALDNQVLCSGSSITAVPFAGNVSGGSYNWVSLHQNIGLTSGNNAAGIAATPVTNTTNATLEDVIVVTPTYGTCNGTPVSFHIYVNPIPTAHTIEDESYCLGQTTNIINLTGNVQGATYEWAFSNAAIKLGIATATSNTIDPFITLATGSSDINVIPSYTHYGVTCPGVSTKVGTITVTTQPIAGFTTSVSGLGKITFANTSINATSYAWDFGDGTTSALPTPTAKTYAASGTYTVTLVAKNGNCIDVFTRTLAVSVSTDLEAKFSSPSISTQCLSGNSFSFKNNSKLTTPGYSISGYSWNFGDGTAAVTTTDAMHTYTQPGSYVVTLTATETPGNTQSSYSQTVTVLDKPGITDGAALVICEGEKLTVNMPTITWNGNTPTTGMWLLNGSLFDPSSTILTAADSNKLLQYRITSVCGDTTSKGVRIIVNKNPVANFATAVTGLGKIAFTNKSTNATNWAWDFGDGSIVDNSQNPVHTYASTGTYTVTLTVKSVGGCTSTISKAIAVVTVSDLQAAFDVNNATQCLTGNSFSFKDMSRLTIPNHTINTWQWNFGDGTTASTKDAAHSYTKAGIYTVTLKVTETPGNTVDSVKKTVTVIAKPGITDGAAPAAICEGEKLTVNLPTINWNGNTPSTGFWLLNGSFFDPNSTILTTADHNKLLQYRIASVCGDSTSVGVRISVKAKPVANFATAVTGLGKIAFTDKSTNATAWAWDFGDGSAIDNSQNPVHTYASTGTYLVTLTAKSAGGCTSTISKTIAVVTTSDLQAAFDVNNATQCLIGNSFSFKDMSKITLPNHTINTWQWNFGDGTTATTKDATHSYTKAGTYTVTLKVTETPGNTIDSVKKTVTVLAKPGIADGTAPAAICEGEKLAVNLPTINWNGNTPSTGLWLLNGSFFDPSNTILMATDNNKLLQYRIASVCGDTTSVGVRIVVNSKPIADFTTAVSGLGVITFTNKSSGAVSYNWNFGDGSTSTQQNPVHTYAQSGTYAVTLTVTSANGCSTTIIRSLAVSTTTDLEAKFTSPSLSTQCLSANSFSFKNISKLTTPGYRISAYDWNFGDGSAAITTADATHIYTQAGSYVVTLTITEAPGNTQSSFSQTVTVLDKPVISNEVIPAAVCEGQRLQVNMPNITWNNNTPVNGYWLLDNTLFDPTVTTVGLADNGKKLQYQLETACGVVTSVGTTITVKALPITATYQDQVYCHGSQVPAFNLRSMSGVTYRWIHTGDNIGLSVLSGNDSLPAFEVVNRGTGILTAYFDVTAYNGSCQGNTTRFSVKVMPSARVSSDLQVPAICSGNTFAYDIQSLTQGALFQWNRISNAAINGGNAANGNTAHIQEILSSNSAAIVTVEYEILTTSHLCAQPYRDTLRVAVKPKPVVTIANGLVEVCANQTIAKLGYSTAVDIADVFYSIRYGADGRRAGLLNETQVALTADSIDIQLPGTLQTGYYTGTLTLESGAGCKGEESYEFDIQVVESTQITEQPKAAHICQNQDFVLSVTAVGKNLTYQWYKNNQAISGATQSTYEGTEVGDYHVIVSGRCGSISSNMVAIAANPLVILQKWNDVIFVSNEAYAFTAYQWYKNEKAVAVNGQYQSYTQTGGLEGTFAVQVTYADGTKEMSCPYTINTQLKGREVRIYPNPIAKNQSVTVDMSLYDNEYENAQVEVFNVAGKRVAHLIMHQAVENMSLQATAGTYILRIKTASGEVINQKLIVL